MRRTLPSPPRRWSWGVADVFSNWKRHCGQRHATYSNCHLPHGNGVPKVVRNSETRKTTCTSHDERSGCRRTTGGRSWVTHGDRSWDEPNHPGPVGRPRLRPARSTRLVASGTYVPRGPKPVLDRSTGGACPCLDSMEVKKVVKMRRTEENKGKTGCKTPRDDW